MAKYGLTRELGQRTAIKRDESGRRVGGGTLITEEIQRKAAGDIAGLVVIRENNTEAIINAIDGAIAAALEEIGLSAERFAKRACPVDTGRLRNSITHALSMDEEAVYIGTNVEYATYVENGTSMVKARPFLKPAAENHGDYYRSILKKHLEGA